jgi:hypothetical protein
LLVSTGFISCGYLNMRMVKRHSVVSRECALKQRRSCFVQVTEQ